MDDGLYFAIKLLYVLPFSKYSTPKVLSTEQFLRSDNYFQLTILLVLKKSGSILGRADRSFKKERRLPPEPSFLLSVYALTTIPSAGHRCRRHRYFRQNRNLNLSRNPGFLPHCLPLPSRVGWHRHAARLPRACSGRFPCSDNR